jgi:NAD-dependent deacetylase sirtuin 5
MSSDIPIKELPRCEMENCGALLRPDIIWFGEELNENVLQKAGTLIL